MLAPRPAVHLRRERWEAPDGDFVDVDFLDRIDLVGGGDPAGRGEPAAGEARSPLLVLFHGLEGSSASHYARALMAEAARRGWRGAVVHFRTCSGELNRLPRFYHSGDSDEIDWTLRRFAREHAHGGPLYAIGVSLGGNALLKWLGERGHEAAFVAAAVALSPPHDLHAGATVLASGFSRLYTASFLKTLKAKCEAKARLHPGAIDLPRMRAARDFFAFDGAVTAPLHGFRDALDYWTRSSCKPFLRGIAVPTLVINALNDPFQPAWALARRHEASPSVRLEYPREGGHVGFLTDGLPGRFGWVPRRAFEFLQHGR